MSPQKLAKTPQSRRNLWFERVMALLAVANLGLVLFDLTYIPLRDFYLREFRSITRIYDPIKGIEPHRETQQYLETVEKLKAQLQQTEGLQSPEVATLLEELRQQSVEMIETNPFAEANKTGTLEKIKNRMRQRVGNVSAKQSFSTFWSLPYLSQAGVEKEITFYNQEIQPLMARNYFRPVGETGNFVDYFWKIDLWFIIPFGIEFLLRTYYIHRRHHSLTWLEAMMWRWYDIFLLLPFWRWLRVISVFMRLHQAQLLNLESIRVQINRGFAANFAEELAEVIVIRVINQLQGSIRGGELTRWLSGREARPYVDINNVNEVEAIATLLMKVTVNQVLPKIQPDLEAILQHNIEKILSQSPFYRGLQQVPGVGTIPTQITEKLVKEISLAAYNTLTASLEDDPVGAELSKHLMEHFTEALGSEVQRQQTVQKIQSLLFDLLEEMKLNYVQRLSEQDLEQVLEETRAIRQIVKQ
ncbi:hypothetical protein [Coleofasciculus sp. FACHB-SPT9]|uniref:hypothetical protein n=1 Tax=Cyanophyceae TaxID=3028117 RepID=UPI001683F34F|nr:hypothetical protein [Coleofasciculus sp. FACHB-SPT9]MBD1887779.1 hypothetical protein [Coleofasciculus sp. FACHB-SPT9]